MMKKHFILVADFIRRRQAGTHGDKFTLSQLWLLADCFEVINPEFNRERWLRYINGDCGPSGGQVKRQK